MKFSRAELFGYLSLIFFFIAIACIVKFTSVFKREAVFFVEEDDDAQPLAAQLSVDTVYVNTATAFQMRRFGFRSYEIVNILIHRDFGGVLRSHSDLLAIHGIDSARLALLHSQIRYDHNDIGITGIYRRRRGDSWENEKPRSAQRQPRQRKVGLHFADSAELIAAGMHPAAWDSLSHYRNTYILKGSVAFDSLVQAQPSDIAGIVGSHIAGTKHKPTPRTDKPKAAPSLVELNSATVEQLCELPYIKEGRAKIIVERRKKLGGYVAVEQLRELYCIDSLVYSRIAPRITIDTTRVAKLRVNKLAPEVMSRHPYISRTLALKIYKRKKRGAYRSFADIEPFLTEEDNSPYLPYYLSFE